jgi:hypothetical protein
MYGDLEAMKAYWKEMETEETSVDIKISNGPCFLSAAHLTASSGGAATAIIRDGHDTTGEAKIYLSALTSATDPRFFSPPLYFKRGLYIDLASNVTSVLVHFLPARPRREP